MSNGINQSVATAVGTGEGTKVVSAEKFQVERADDFKAVIDDLASRPGSFLSSLTRTHQELAEYDGIVSEFEISENYCDIDKVLNYHLFYEILKTAQVMQLKEMKGVVIGEGYYVFATYCNKSGGKRTVGFKLLFLNGVITEMIEIRQTDLQKLITYINNSTSSTPKRKTDPDVKLFQSFEDNLQDYGQQGIQLDAKLIVRALGKCLKMLDEVSGYTDVSEV